MAEEKKVPIITVRGTEPHDGKVILYERDDAHPPTLNKDGQDTGRPHEAFITNTLLPDGKVQEYQVAETAAVKRLIADGALEKVGGASTPTEERRVVAVPTEERRK